MKKYEMKKMNDKFSITHNVSLMSLLWYRLKNRLDEHNLVN